MVLPARQLRVAVLLLGGAFVAWIVTAARMRGMDAGPGTDLGGLGWFLGIWLTMTAAMMLPSSAPMVLAYARSSRRPGCTSSRRSSRPACATAAGPSAT
jgi:hypothetical protein